MTFHVKNPKKKRSCFSRTFHMESPVYYKSGTNLEIHVNAVHKGKILKCEICNSDFNRKSTLRAHKQVKHEGKQIPCTLCPYTTIRASSLLLHMKSLHLGNKPESFYHCKQCSKSFARDISLKLHTMTHTGERPNKCLQCNKSFILLRSLVIHNKTHDKKLSKSLKKDKIIFQKPPKYKCTLCFFSTRNNMLYRRHNQTHKVKSYKCLKCDMICSSVTSLLHHKRNKHPRKNKMEKCNICNQTSNKNSHTHKEPNTNHVCSECNKRFVSKSNMKLDVVGPVDNRPSTHQLNHFVPFF